MRNLDQNPFETIEKTQVSQAQVSLARFLSIKEQDQIEGYRVTLPHPVSQNESTKEP